MPSECSQPSNEATLCRCALQSHKREGSRTHARQQILARPFVLLPRHVARLSQLRCGGLITFVTLCENWDAASVVDSVSTNELRHNSLESNHLELNAHLPMQLLLQEFAQELDDVCFACARSTMQ